MLKLFGSIIIITASMGIAYCIQRDMEEHLRLLYEMRKLFLDIAYAASESMQPMEVLLGCFVRAKDERLNFICRQIAEGLLEKKEGKGEEVWERVFAKERRSLGLSQEEAEVAERAGSAFFGKSVEENEKHLEYTLERLDFLIENIRKEQKEKQKVYQTVSVMGGFLLILLLI